MPFLNVFMFRSLHRLHGYSSAPPQGRCAMQHCHVPTGARRVATPTAGVRGRDRKPGERKGSWQTREEGVNKSAEL